VAWLAFLGSALAGLHASSIPVTDGVSAGFAGVRIVAMAIGAYLLVVTLLGLALRALRLGAAVRVSDLVTVPFVRRLLNRAATVVLATSLVAPAGAHAAERPPDPPPVMRLIDDPPPPAAAPALAPAAPSVDSYVVQPGDNLWSITERLLTQRLGRPPSDAEVVPHWQTLIADNADRLRDPSLIFSGQVLRIRAG
jgi:hypothetical protein